MVRHMGMLGIPLIVLCPLTSTLHSESKMAQRKISLSHHFSLNFIKTWNNILFLHKRLHFVVVFSG